MQDFLVKVKVTAGSSKEKVIELDSHNFEIFVKEPAQNGLANQRVRTLLARNFGVVLANVRLSTGHQSRNKKFIVTM